MAKKKAKAKTKAKAKAKAMKAVSSSSSSQKVLKKPARVALKNTKYFLKKQKRAERKQAINTKHRALNAAARGKLYQPRKERLQEVAKVALEGLSKANTAIERINSVDVKVNLALSVAREVRDRLNDRDDWANWDLCAEHGPDI